MAALAGGAAPRLGPGSVLALRAALAPNTKLVEPGLDIPHAQFVQPFAAEIQNDVEPGEQVVVGRSGWSQVGHHHLSQPSRHEIGESRRAGGDRTASRELMESEPFHVNLLPRLPVDHLALRATLRCGDPRVCGEAVSVGVDGSLPVVPPRHAGP